MMLHNNCKLKFVYLTTPLKNKFFFILTHSQHKAILHTDIHLSCYSDTILTLFAIISYCPLIFSGIQLNGFFCLFVARKWRHEPRFNISKLKSIPEVCEVLTFLLYIFELERDVGYTQLFYHFCQTLICL